MMPTTKPQPDPTIINLDEYEVSWAESVGLYRFSESERDGKTQSDGSRAANGLRNHQQGAAAELALTKFLGMKWNATVNTYNSFPDLDGYLECRSKQPAQQHLRLHPNRDKFKGSAVFASVTCLKQALSSFRIDGWILGSEAMKQAYLTKTQWGKEEWHVPLADLRSSATFRIETARRLSVVSKGRERLREWVRKTLEADQQQPL